MIDETIGMVRELDAMFPFKSVDFATIPNFERSVQGTITLIH